MAVIQAWLTFQSREAFARAISRLVHLRVHVDSEDARGRRLRATIEGDNVNDVLTLDGLSAESSRKLKALARRRPPQKR